MKTLPAAGRWLFAISIIAFGVQNIYYKGFVVGVGLTPKWIFAHTFWAYLMGALLIAGGLSIASGVLLRWGAFAVGAIYFAGVIFAHLPRINRVIGDIGERTVLLEPLAIGCAALLLGGFRGPYRAVFGATMIVFGVAHFQVPAFIASLIPHWMPARLFLAWFTGLAMAAAGISITIRWRLRLFSNLLGLMFLVWVVTLHAPRVVADLHNGDEWNSAFIALAMCGACWFIPEADER